MAAQITSIAIWCTKTKYLWCHVYPVLFIYRIWSICTYTYTYDDRPNPPKLQKKHRTQSFRLCCLKTRKTNPTSRKMMNVKPLKTAFSEVLAKDIFSEHFTFLSKFMTETEFRFARNHLMKCFCATLQLIQTSVDSHIHKNTLTFLSVDIVENCLVYLRCCYHHVCSKLFKKDELFINRHICIDWSIQNVRHGIKRTRSMEKGSLWQQRVSGQLHRPIIFTRIAKE